MRLPVKNEGGQHLDQKLYDYIGNSYKRKNLYLQEVADLENEIARTKDRKTKAALKAQLAALLKGKDLHEYVKSLREYEEKEKAFLEQLKQDCEAYKASFTSDNKKVNTLKMRYFKATKEEEFYKPYVDLCYDAEVKYKSAFVIFEQMKEVIDHLESNLKDLAEAKISAKTKDPQKESAGKKAYKVKKAEVDKQYKINLKKLKDKKKEGLISNKALENEKRQLIAKKKKDTSILANSLIPSKYYKEVVENKTYETTKAVKQKLAVIDDNESNVLRTVPSEVESNLAGRALATCWLPGLGQYLNGQTTKMWLFLMGSFFIYCIAIPYAFGFGNYQAEGLKSLITLANGTSKLNKSMIFMVEGIIALFMILLGIGIFIISYIDVKHVAKNIVKGIRPKNWFETKRGIFEEGFPYLVSLPAFIVILFIVIVPLSTTILLSFTNMDPKHQSKYQWAGLTNYLELATAEGMIGTVFWAILGWTLIWTFVATTFAIVIGFGLALLTNNERIKGKGFFRGVFILPWAIPGFISIMFFGIMFARQGILTQILNGITGLTLDIKNNSMQTRIVLILMQGWLGSAYVFLLSTGVLQAIPADLYEAAQIDGATSWQRLAKITLPIVLFQTAPLLIGQYTFNFNNFSIIYLFNGGGPFDPTIYGNLAGSTDILISYIYKLTMDSQEQAVGAAVTMIISLALMIFTFIGFKNSKAFKED